MRRYLVIALSLIVSLLVGGAVQGQRLDGSLRVTVTDKSQASVEDAKVSVTNTATGVTSVTTASSSGTYVFPNLLVGAYTVSVEKDGFKKAINKNVVIESNQVAEVKTELELGEVSATVEVEAGADLVKTDSSELGATFSGQAVADLPVNTLGGDVKEFAVFVPGTTTQQAGVQGSAGSIGGTPPRLNRFFNSAVSANLLHRTNTIRP